MIDKMIIMLSNDAYKASTKNELARYDAALGSSVQTIFQIIS